MGKGCALRAAALVVVIVGALLALAFSPFELGHALVLADERTHLGANLRIRIEDVSAAAGQEDFASREMEARGEHPPWR